MATCQACGGELRWVRIGDRWHGQNPDGSDHWDLCSQRKLQHFQKHGTEFANERERGLKVPTKQALNGKTVQMLERVAKVIKGKHYKPSACSCGLPPWESCKPNCEHTFEGRK